jgi:hypothetical protein
VNDKSEFQGSQSSIFWTVSFLFVLVMALSHGAAFLAAQQTKNHDVFYFFVIFTIWACIFLLTPALCFHIFSRSEAGNYYWRAFWTFAFLALLVHLYWAYAGPCGRSLTSIFNHKATLDPHPDCKVENPWPDSFLAAWWGLDVVLAWAITDNLKWVRFQRGGVHLLAFLMFFGAFVLADKASIEARMLGVLMAIIVIGCLVVRLIVSDNDPKSPLMMIYVRFFQLLNLFVVWHKLPTFLAVANLGALREVLRAKNLHDTSRIAVTVPSGLRPLVQPDVRYLSEREEDGQYNDLSKPTMGNASLGGSDFTLSNPGARFGRNIPLSEVDPARDGAILDPNPRLVSTRLLGRATTPGGATTSGLRRY